MSPCGVLGPAGLRTRQGGSVFLGPITLKMGAVRRKEAGFFFFFLFLDFSFSFSPFVLVFFFPPLSLFSLPFSLLPPSFFLSFIFFLFSALLFSFFSIFFSSFLFSFPFLFLSLSFSRGARSHHRPAGIAGEDDYPAWGPCVRQKTLKVPLGARAVFPAEGH